MSNETTESNATSDAAGRNERLVMREGYCCDCNNNPEMPLPDAAKTAGNKCNGCWLVDEKPCWQSKGGKQYCTDEGVLMNADGSRSIFDDVDA